MPTPGQARRLGSDLLLNQVLPGSVRRLQLPSHSLITRFLLTSLSLLQLHRSLQYSNLALNRKISTRIIHKLPGSFNKMSSPHLTQLRKWLFESPPIEWGVNQVRELLIGALRQGPIPQHVAFVMDGNRRFARSHKIETVEGHNLGFEALARVSSNPLEGTEIC